LIPETGFFSSSLKARKAIFELTVRVIVGWQLQCGMASQGTVFAELTESVLKAHYEGQRRMFQEFPMNSDICSHGLDDDDCPMPIADFSDDRTTILPSDLASKGRSALKRKWGLLTADVTSPESESSMEFEVSVAPTESVQWIFGSEELCRFSDVSSNGNAPTTIEISDSEPTIHASDNDSEPVFPENQAMHDPLPEQDCAWAISHLAN